MIKRLVFLLLMISGCQSSLDSTVQLPSGDKLLLPHGKTLSVVITSEPPKLDWALSSDTDSSWIQEHIMEGLVRFDLTKPGLNLKPALATDWKTTDDGSTWVFNLRKGVLWSDGVEFTADHVLQAYEYILDPLSAAIAVDNIFPIKNAKLFNAGKIKKFEKVGVKKIHSHKIVFSLEQPMAFFPMLLTHHTHFPMRRDVIKKHKELWTEPQNIVTLGPYRLIYWHHDSRLVLAKNETYWGGAPKISYINFYMIEKDSTKLRMFERGKIDFIRDLPSSEIPRLSKRPEYHFLPGLRLYYYGLKVNRPPMTDPLLRRAIAHAIDRSEVVKVLGGGQETLPSWVPGGMFGHEKEIGLKFDPEKAKQLFAQTDYAKQSQKKPLVLGFNTEEKHKQVAENIQAQLKRNLGLKVELKNEEWKTFLNGLRGDSNYHIFRLGWVADYADPHNFMAIMTSFSENNRTGWKNLEYDNLVQQALQETDNEKRLNLYQKAQKILVEDQVPVIPLLTDVNQVLVSQRIKNYHNNVLDLYHFQTMEIAQ